MSLGKKLFIGGGAACFTDSVQPFGADSAYSSNVALYQLDGNANDTVGNYNGTASNVTYSTGKYGQSAYFNGTNSSIDIGTISELPSNTNNEVDFTFSAWVKSNTTDLNAGGGSNPIFVNQNNSYQFIGFGGNDNANFPTGRIFYYTFGGSGQHNSWIITDETFDDDNWHHVVVTDVYSAVNNNRTRTLYVDNVQRKQDTVDKNFNANTVSTYLGSTSNAYSKQYLDQVRIFSKGLSRSEISILYNETDATASDTNVLSEGAGVALYTLDYDASDAGGNYDGISSNVTFGVDGQINYGAKFNGSNSKIDLGSNIADVVTFDGSGSTDECTLSFWVQPQDATSTNYNCLFSVGYGLELYHVNNRFTSFSNNVASGTGREIDGFQTTSTYSPNQWHHVVFVFTPTSQKWYINGSLDGSNTTTSYTPHPEPTATIGTFKNTSPAYDNLATFNGLIDHVRIFNKVLSSTQISTLYAETACVYTSTTDTVGFPSSASSNLFAYYKLDNTGNDESANGHDGTPGSSMAYSFGRFGTGGSFDGSNNAVITIPDSNKFSPSVNDFSVSFWFNTSSTTTNRLIAKGSNPYEWEIWVSNGRPVYASYQSAGATHGVLYGGVDPGIYADGNWHHLVVTHDYGTKAEIFLDNVSLNSLTSFTGSMSNTNSTVTIGKRGDQSSSLTGKLDQIRFYDKILTTDEIAELYNEKPEAQPNFNAVLYNGTDSDRYVSNIGFQPDLVWIKRRNSTNAAVIQDSVRGANNYIMPHSSSAEASSTSFDSFEANGFELTGAGGSWNNSAGTYVAWVWKGGGDAVSNTNGTITSQVSANTAAGFSIVKYTGNGTDNATVGTGLSSAAELVIVKDLTSANYWCVGGSAVGNGENLYLNETGQKLTRDRVKSVQTNTFTLGNHSETNSTNNFIAYCFHSVSGYQKIGSFTYSAGVSVNVGFEPQFVMFKKTSAAGSWTIVDNKRFSGTTDYGLFANLDAAEVTNTDYLNLTSTGFTTTYSDTGTFIYLAIA